MAALLMLLFVPAATAQSSRCTETGNTGSNRLIGTPQHDIICAHAGEDYANGKGSTDVVRGGGGNDTLVGGDGTDFIYGKEGNDQIFATDQEPNDRIDGGPGTDRCYGDVGDSFSRCEHKVVL